MGAQQLPRIPDLAPLDDIVQAVDFLRVSPLSLLTLPGSEDSHDVTRSDPGALTQGADDNTIRDLIKASAQMKGEAVAVST
jgi:hypothetical protein